MILTHYNVRNAAALFRCAIASAGLQLQNDVQNFGKCKITLSAKLRKVQDYAKYKVIENAISCTVQTYVK